MLALTKQHNNNGSLLPRSSISRCSSAVYSRKNIISRQLILVITMMVCALSLFPNDSSCSLVQALKASSRLQQKNVDDVELLQEASEISEQIEGAMREGLDSESSASIRIVLKRRQKYLYDYFFPKNMRDAIEEKKKNKTASTGHGGELAQGNKLDGKQQANQSKNDQKKYMNQCELNKNSEQGSGGLGLHLNNHMDFSYVADIYVGNKPAQKIRALFDTGSANTWILNKKVHSSDMHFSYDDKMSSTAKRTTQRAFISFGSGSLSGHFYIDDFRIGGCQYCQSTSQILIKNQKFGNVEKEDSIFRENFDAIVGLAYPNFAERGITPVFDNMIQQKLLQDNLFAFFLTSKMDEEMSGLDSELTFGYYDKSKYTGDMVWHPILHKLMFGIALDDIKVNGVPMNLCNNPNQQICLITVDSGTSEMTMPSWAVKKVLGKMPLKTNPMKCNDTKQFGELTFVINGFEYTLPNDDWVEKNMDDLNGQTENSQISSSLKSIKKKYQSLAQVDLGPTTMGGFLQELEEMSIPPDPQLSLTQNQPQSINLQTKTDVKMSQKSQEMVQADTAKDSCTSVVSALDLGNKNTFIVGDIFMRKFYTVFDRDNDRVGIALAVTADQIKEKNKQKMMRDKAKQQPNQTQKVTNQQQK